MGHYWDNIKPDIVTMAKSMSGGYMAISGVLADDEVMLGIKPGEHGSTYGGNPLACSIARAAIDVILDERLCENSLIMGETLNSKIDSIRKSKLIKEVRG